MTRGLFMDTRGWDAGNLLVTVNSLPATYTATLPDNNALDVAAAVCTWMLAGARPWSPGVTGCTFTLQASGTGYQSIHFVVTAGVLPVSIVPTGSWAVAGKGLFALDGAELVGSVDADIILQNWTRWDPARGVSARAGSYRPMHQAYTARRPRVEGWLDPGQHIAMCAAQRAAAAPRGAQVFEPIAAAWRAIVVGDIAYDQKESSWTRVGLEALG